MYLSDFALLGAFIKWGISGFKGKFKDFYDDDKYFSVRLLAYLGLGTFIIILILIVMVLSVF